MLIISKFRDYYDASVGYGIDKTIVYERDTRIVKSKDFSIDNHLGGNNYFLRRSNLNDDSVNNEWKIIGFCGKTYVALIQTKKDVNGQQQIIDCYYGQEALARVYEKDIKRYWWYDVNKETAEFIDKWHDRECTSFFIDNNTPVFYVQPLTNYQAKYIDVTINPCLAEFKFFRVFDSFSAFQEIQMFISGVLGTGSPKTLEISNTEKIKQYGYDPKWSFRNPDPPKRKQ